MKKSERSTDENSETIRKAKIALEKKQLNQKRLRTIFTYALLPLVFGAGLASGSLIFNENGSGKGSDGSHNVSVEKVEKSLTGKSSEQDKKDAVAGLQKVLREAGVSKGNLDLEERLTQIDKDDYKDVSPGLMENFLWKDGLDKKTGVKANAVQGLITMNYVIAEKGNKGINPSVDDVSPYVYLDQENGRAFVPVSIFYGPSNSMSIEMIYDSESKEWKMDPYSFVESLRLSASLQGKLPQGQTQPSN